MYRSSLPKILFILIVSPNDKYKTTSQMVYILILESDLAQLSLSTETVSMLGLYFHHIIIPNLKSLNNIKAGADSKKAAADSKKMHKKLL